MRRHEAVEDILRRHIDAIAPLLQAELWALLTAPDLRSAYPRPANTEPSELQRYALNIHRGGRADDV